MTHLDVIVVLNTESSPLRHQIRPLREGAQHGGHITEVMYAHFCVHITCNLIHAAFQFISVCEGSIKV